MSDIYDYHNTYNDNYYDEFYKDDNSNVLERQIRRLTAENLAAIEAMQFYNESSDQDEFDPWAIESYSEDYVDDYVRDDVTAALNWEELFGDMKWNDEVVGDSSRKDETTIAAKSVSNPAEVNSKSTTRDAAELGRHKRAMHDNTYDNRRLNYQNNDDDDDLRNRRKQQRIRNKRILSDILSKSGKNTNTGKVVAPVPKAKTFLFGFIRWY